MKFLLVSWLFVLTVTQQLYPFTCSQSSMFLNVGQLMTPITCSISMPNIPRVTPDLPSGLFYEIVSVGNYRTVTISGTPLKGANPRLYYIGFNAYISTVEIAVYDAPKVCSYGFDSMTLYTEVDMEPIPIQCDAAVNSFTVSPTLPNGMIIDATTGTISGRLVSESSDSVVYTVTATTDGKGSISTTFTFRARSYSEMTTRGAIGCYWKSITECRVPDFDFFYKNPAQVCQTVGELMFTDNNVDNTWPGLDRRFVDYYSAYFYTYILISSPGSYNFKLSSDDGAMMYLDNLNEVFISREACRGLSESPNSKFLDSGRHLLVIRFFEYNSWSSMYVKIGNNDIGMNDQFVSAEHMRVGGRGPTFISYDFIAGYVNMDLPYYMPQLSSGAPILWEVSPPLPQGMSIDVNGYITGRPSISVSGTYKITATGVNGIASTNVRIVITSTMNQGYRTKFYKVNDPDLCKYHLLTGNTIMLSKVAVTDTINFPETAISVVWNGFPSDFTNYFYMEWEGYLRMDIIGRWKLRLTCDDGCKLIAADEQHIIDYWGCHNFLPYEAQYAVSKKGYYYFRVEYQQNQNNKGITFEWQAPGGIWEIVPASVVYFLPSGVLSYKAIQTHYYKDVEIEENTPVLFSVTGLSQYTVFPAFPAGLMINSMNGVISGTPTIAQPHNLYTVTARNGMMEETSIISFDVLSLGIPSGLAYMYSGNVITVSTPIVLIPLRLINPITIQNSLAVSISHFTVNPDLPVGLTLNRLTGAITGTPRQTLVASVFSITAHNPAGTFMLMINLSVSGCKGASGWTGEFVHVWMRSGEGIVSVQNSGGQVQQCSVDIMNAEGNAESIPCSTSMNSLSTSRATFCVDPSLTSSLIMKITCNNNNGCRWQVSKDDGSYYPYRFAYQQDGLSPYNDQIAYPITLTPLNSITLSKNEITAYSGHQIETIETVLNGCYKTITIAPILGSVVIDKGYPLLIGIASGIGRQVYTITATGSAGTATAMLTIDYGECSSASGRKMITIEKTTKAYGNEESFELRLGNEVLYSSGILKNDLNYWVTMCLAAGSYSVVMKDTYGDGWSTGSFISIVDESRYTLGSWTFSHPGSSIYKEKIETWILDAEVSELQWKYLTTGRPDRDWNKVGGNRNAWKSMTFGIAGDWSQNGVYFVHEFTLADGELYPIIEFGIYYRDGLIVYLNEQEVYRRNMGSGTSSSTQASSGSFDGYLIRVGTAAGHILRTGDNVLAVEMHRAPSGVSGPIQWNGYVKYTANDCVVRSVGGTIRESIFYDKTGETAYEAWGTVANKQWTENGLPAWTTYSYDFDHVEWVNRITVGAAIGVESDAYKFDIAKFTVYGSNDGVSWDRLYSYEKNEMFSTRGELIHRMMMDHMNSYGQYKFEINRSRSGVARVSVSKIALEACKLVYCPKDGDYPGTLSGETVTINCREGYIGERYRQCGSDKLKPTWEAGDENECRSQSPAKGVSYVDFAYVVSLVSVSNMQVDGVVAISSVLSTYLSLESKAIEVWKVKDVTSLFVNSEMGDIQKTAVWVRITVSDEGASNVLNKIVASLVPVKADLTQFYEQIFIKSTLMSFYIEPQLSQFKGAGKVSVGLIILMVIVVLVVVALVAFFLWTRMKNRKMKNGSKKLSRSGKSKVEKKSDSKKARV